MSPLCTDSFVQVLHKKLPWVMRSQKHDTKYLFCTSQKQASLVSKCQKWYRSTYKKLPTEVCPGLQKSSGRRAESISPSGQTSPLQQGRTVPCFPVIETGSLKLVCRRNGIGCAARPQQCKACSAVNAHKTVPCEIFLQSFWCSTKFTMTVLDLQG